MSEGGGRDSVEGEPAAQSLRSAIPLTALEIASGVIIGEAGDNSASEASPPNTFHEAMDACLTEALLRPPCLVAFSGGRDSSAMLAWATDVARREGLDLPVPATHVFPAATHTEEGEWQESVTSHLRLSDWHRMSWTDELDLLGPYATAGLKRHGLLWPSNSHFLTPIFEAAPGGTVITGIGGDELFGWWPWARAAAVIGRSQKPEYRDILRVGLALAPGFVKRRVLRRRSGLDLGWLRPSANRAIARASAAEDASMPFFWAARVAWLMRRRYLSINLHSAQLLASDSDVDVVHPLVDPGVTASLARAGGNTGYADRTAAYLQLFGERLPSSILERQDKTWFDEIFWQGHTREFLSLWNGETGIMSLIDEDSLRKVWSSHAPDGRSATLLQHVWLQAQP